MTPFPRRILSSRAMKCPPHLCCGQTNASLVAMLCWELCRKVQSPQLSTPLRAVCRAISMMSNRVANLLCCRGFFVTTFGKLFIGHEDRTTFLTFMKPFGRWEYLHAYIAMLFKSTSMGRWGESHEFLRAILTKQWSHAAPDKDDDHCFPLPQLAISWPNWSFAVMINNSIDNIVRANLIDIVIPFGERCL